MPHSYFWVRNSLQGISPLWTDFLVFLIKFRVWVEKRGRIGECSKIIFLTAVVMHGESAHCGSCLSNDRSVVGLRLVRGNRWQLFLYKIDEIYEYTFCFFFIYKLHRWVCWASRTWSQPLAPFLHLDDMFLISCSLYMIILTTILRRAIYWQGCRYMSSYLGLLRS